jgi:hypothetical protein
MRKIDQRDFASYRLERPVFTYTGVSFNAMLKAFGEWASPCKFVGIKHDGSEAILDQK